MFLSASATTVTTGNGAARISTASAVVNDQQVIVFFTTISISLFTPVLQSASTALALVGAVPQLLELHHQIYVEQYLILTKVRIPQTPPFPEQRPGVTLPDPGCAAVHTGDLGWGAVIGSRHSAEERRRE